MIARQAFDALPHLSRWLEDMQRIEGHDEVHTPLSLLGAIDREPPSMDTIKNANKAGFDAHSETESPFFPITL